MNVVLTTFVGDEHKENYKLMAHIPKLSWSLTFHLHSKMPLSPLEGLTARNPLWNLQVAQVGPPGAYGVVPPASSYPNSLPIQALGQQPLSQGLAPAGPYTALLGPQMQSLLPPGVLPPGQYPAGFPTGMQTPLQTMQQPLAVPPKKRQREHPPATCFEHPDRLSIVGQCLGASLQSSSGEGTVNWPT